MTEQEYNVAEGIRRSDLTKLNRSPAHYKYAVEHPSEPTPAMVFGTAFHAAVLQPEEFDNQFMVADFDARTKEGKALKQEALDKGLTLLSKDTMEQIEAMKTAIESNPFAKRLLTGDHETSHFWTDPETGEICKCRTDCETDINGVHYIVDLKTCTNAATDEFVRDATKFGYFVQAAMYTEGVKQTTGVDSVFVFVAVEKDPPYAVNVMECGPDEIRLGMNGSSRSKVAGFRDLLNLYHKCRVEDKWPGYEGFDLQINEITLPKWLKDSDDEPDEPEQKAEKEPDKYISVKDLANKLGLSLPVAYALVKQPGFPMIRLTPKRILIMENEVYGWLKNKCKENN